MRKSTVDVCLPTHPTLTHPRTGEPLHAVGMSRRGPIWPILGGDGTDDGGQGGNGTGNGGQGGNGTGTDNGQNGGQGGAGNGQTGSGSGSGTDDDRGYPTNTPVAEMGPAQQAAYWKFHARKHEDARKALGLTAGNEATELQQLRSDQAELQKRKNAELSDVERLTKERDEFAVKAQGLEIEKIRMNAAATAGLPADMAEFITAVDADGAKQQAETLKARINPGTSAGGSDQGNRRPNGASTGSAAGAAEAKRRFGAKGQTTQT